MLEITWLGHSTFQLRLESGETILIDPWLEGKPTTPASFQVERLDTILVSHGHGDHTGDVIKLSQRFQPKLVAVVELASFFESKGCPNTIGMNRGGFSQAYMGRMDRVGIDLGLASGQTMTWRVYTPGGASRSNMLSGTFVGSSAEATFVVGPGTQMLVDNAGERVALEPMTGSGQAGFSFAVGTAGLDLRPASFAALR